MAFHFPKNKCTSGEPVNAFHGIKGACLRPTFHLFHDALTEPPCTLSNAVEGIGKRKSQADITLLALKKEGIRKNKKFLY